MSGLLTFTIGGITYIFDFNGVDDIQGTSGNDVIFAGGGDDTIYAGAGNDLIFAGSGDDTVYGGAGDDIVLGGSGNDLLFGQKGNDIVAGGSGNDIVKGGTGDDILLGGYGNDIVVGGAGNDILFGGHGADILKGGSGNDLIYAGHDNDIAIYVVGNNIGASDYYNGGDGFDKLRIKMTSTELNELNIPPEFNTVQEKIDYIESLLQPDGSADFNTLGFDLVIEKFEAIQVKVKFLNDVEFALTSDLDSIKEGESIDYTVAYSGTLAAGTSASIDIILNDITTSAADRSDLITAINTAVAGASGVSFDGTTITFDAGGDTSLIFTIDALDDAFVEPDENYSVEISNASTTGTGVASIAVGDNIVGTTIIDTPPIFTNGNDIVNLDTLNPDDFNTALGVQDALGGNDDVWLPNAGASILGFGYNIALPFEGGDGDDIIRPGDLNDIIDGGLGVDEVNYNARTDAVSLSINGTLATATLGTEMDMLSDIESYALTSQNDDITVAAITPLVQLTVDASGGFDTLDLQNLGTGITYTASTGELTDGTNAMTVTDVEKLIMHDGQTLIVDTAKNFTVELAASPPSSTLGDFTRIEMLEGYDANLTLTLEENFQPVSTQEELTSLDLVMRFDVDPLLPDTNPTNTATLDFANGVYSFNQGLAEYALILILSTFAVTLEGSNVTAKVESLLDRDVLIDDGVDQLQFATPTVIIADNRGDSSSVDTVDFSNVTSNGLFLETFGTDYFLAEIDELNSGAPTIEIPATFTVDYEKVILGKDSSDTFLATDIFDGDTVDMGAGIGTDTLDFKSLGLGATYNLSTGELTDGTNTMTVLNVDVALGNLVKETTRVSDNTSAPSFDPSISDDGNFVVYTSNDVNLVPGDVNGALDIFLYDVNLGTTLRVSVDSNGTEADGGSALAEINSNGSFVVFESAATNLVSGDTNGLPDVFLYDVNLATTTRVSVDSAGLEANGSSGNPAINADGSIIAFISLATNLVASDTNNASDIFIHNMIFDTTTLVSVNNTGIQGDGASFNPSVNADGTIIAFSSLATNLVADDTNSFQDIFVHDTSTGNTERVSIGDGVEANGASFLPSISADGQYVVYFSSADNLVSNDTNGFRDVFLFDRNTQTTTLISENTSGSSGNGQSLFAEISSDGDYVVFQSAASDLIASDTNGQLDIFLYEIATGTITRVNEATDGSEADGSSSSPSISADTLGVVYQSNATNLISLDPDTNGVTDIYGFLQ